MGDAARSLTILDFGRANIDLGAVMAPGDADGLWAVCPFPGYLIELADGRRVLIDTGPNRRHIREPMFEFVGRPLADHLIPDLSDADDPLNRLREIGLEAGDIDVLVLTHTHFDHAGNTIDFAGSEIVINRDAHAFGLDCARRGAPGGIPEVDLSGAPMPYRLLDGDSELAPGVTLLHTPGHAAGHMSVLLRLPDTGPVILAIDAIYSRLNHERDNYKIGFDPQAGRDSAHRVIALAEQEHAMLIYGHDAQQWQELRKAPERYT
ncbi:MAG TPA: N-acyl homoserine lactonase family protein [Thermomicrobiales bacterium]|nr:N-acyl homoserine lactonase family protein [Thermomicrobiales bacterium]